MTNKIYISQGMLVAMIVNIIYVKAIGVTQGTLARAVGQDMWIATLLGILQGAVMIYATYLVVRAMPERDFIGIGEALLGRWFGILIALIFIVFFIAAFGPVMITFVYHLKDYFLPEAPLWMFIVAALLVGSLGCFYGLEVMGRIALVGMAFIFMLNLLITIGSTHEFDIRNLLPVFESGVKRTAAASLHYDADCALAIMLAALVLPIVKDVGKKGSRAAVMGIVVSGISVIMWAILESAVLSADVTSQYTVSCMKLARNAHIGDFLQRYEMIMIALYSLSALFQVMFCIYGTAEGAARLFGLKNNKWTIIPSSIVLGFFGYWVIEDHFRAIDYLEHYWPFIAVPIAFGMPLLMLGLSIMVGKKPDVSAAASK
ncbi:GerAB/ArcD/ProY family transporter [Paenibacillus kobensis]|uniref:GerAB/ArcD/ProY family transporter n=1 Tax=Paenibacillus kobensis TaxID=59841 RepID=UPI000FDAE4EA|nr:GerAB/ArcD/ProY family transporter [Paenibacillus kobensis]